MQNDQPIPVVRLKSRKEFKGWFLTIISIVFSITPYATILAAGYGAVVYFKDREMESMLFHSTPVLGFELLSLDGFALFIGLITIPWILNVFISEYTRYRQMMWILNHSEKDIDRLLSSNRLKASEKDLIIDVLRKARR